MLDAVRIFLYVFGALTMAGGIMGYVKANSRPSLIAGTGCGTDRVHNGLPARHRNTACATHIAWRPASPLLVGFEYRHIATRGPGGVFRTGHFSLSFGIEL